MTVNIKGRNRVILRVMWMSFSVITLVELLNFILYQTGVEREYVRPNFFLNYVAIPVALNLVVMFAAELVHKFLADKKPRISAYMISISFVILLNNMIMIHCGIRVVYALYVVPIFLSLVYNQRLLSYVVAILSVVLYTLVVFVYLPTLPSDTYYHTYMDFLANLGSLIGAFFACYAVFESYTDLMVKTISFHDGYLGIKNHLTQVRQIKHEIKNNVIALKILIDNNEFDKAKDYIAELTRQASDAIDTTYCNNVFINAILGNFKKTAADRDIRTEITADVPEYINMKEQDLYSLLANILDNALEASEQAPKKFIKLEIKMTSPYMTISCENGRIAGVIEDFKTTKHDTENHGFGLLIISQIVKKYGGMCSFSHTPDTFSITAAAKV